jgi:hypothetical protein
MKRQGTHILPGASFLLLGTFVWTLVSAPQAKAIPAFARKYQTSCTTCHNNFPELNDFGEAFKKNGFKFPKDDDMFVKEPPVMLGAKAQKEAFPKAVYPGELPGNLPIAFRYSGFAQYNSKIPLAVGFVPRTDLFAPNTFTIIAAGSFGPTLSFWIDDDISTGGSGADGGLGDGYIRANDIGHYLHLPKDALNVRFGQFELDLPFSQARTINLSSYDIFDQASVALVNSDLCPGTDPTLPAPPPCTTNNPFMFGVPQRGIEFGGYPNDGNFSWSVAIVNGNNNSPAARNSKDVYVRISQRFNLERDASVRKEVQAAGPTGPRDHSSLRLGAFGYYGRNALNIGGALFPNLESEAVLPTIHEPFYRVGGDFRFKYRQFELWGLGMYGHDTNEVVNANETGFEHAPPVTFAGGFAEAEYWIHPWLIGLMRYDFVNSPTDFQNGVSRFRTRNRFSPGFQILVRSNIKLALEYQRRFEQPNPSSVPAPFFRANGFSAGADFLF